MIQKTNLLPLSNTAIKLVILLFIPLAIFIFLPLVSSAQNFSFSSPESADVSSSFQVSIDFSDSKTYDVKVYSEDPASSPKTISEIFDGTSWQNSYFYLKGFFPAQKEFQVRINKAGNWQLCAKLKNSTTLGPVCNSITITGNSSAQTQITPPPEATPSEDNVEKNNTPSDASQIKDSSSSASSNIQALALSTPSKDRTPLAEIAHSPIILKSEEVNSSFITKQGYLRIALGISFTFLLLIISILLALRQL